MLGVSVAGLKSSIENIYPVQLVMTDNNNKIQLDLIVVDEESRGMGVGREVMEMIISYSEFYHKPIELTPSGEFGGSVRKLKKFYKHLGFKKNKHVYSIMHYSMIRNCTSKYN